MAREARELEAFLKGIEGQEAHSRQTGELAGELEVDGILRITKTASKVELPKGIRREILTIGTMIKSTLLEEFRQRGIHVTSYAQDIIDRIEFSDEPQDIELGWLGGRDLGLRRASAYRRFLEAGQEAAGLNIVRPEVGLYLRLQDTEQPLGDCYWVAMEPVTDRHGRPRVLALGHDDLGLWLSASWVRPSSQWRPGDRLVFSLSK